MARSHLLLTMFTAALLGAPRPALAHGLNLAWDDCFLGDARTSLTNACTAAGDSIRSLVVSVVPHELISNVNGAQGTIDVIFEAGDLPDYWRFDAGGCRQGKLTVDLEVGAASPPYSCAEPWSAVPGIAGGVNFAPYYGSGCNNRARITWIVAIPGITALDPSVSSEWYIIRLRIAAGGLECSGCSVPACMVADLVRLTRPAGTLGGDVFVEGPATSPSARWQKPTFFCYAVHDPGPCPTPTMRSTWGQIKAVYR